MENEHLKGHKSFAEMVSTHIASFRAALEFCKANSTEPIVFMPYGDEDQGESELEPTSYYAHELKALDDIEAACNKELNNAS